jgi:hypothetical protein
VHHVDNHSKMINLKPVTVAGQRVRKWRNEGYQVIMK